MKKFLLAIIGVLGIGSSSSLIAAQYTHNLFYTPTSEDNNGTLSGQITFDDGDANKNDNFVDVEFGNMQSIDRGLIPSISFTYQAEGLAAKTIEGLDITGFVLVHANQGSTDYSAANIKTQFTQLRFFSNGNEFNLFQSDLTFNQQAGPDANNEMDDDFTLNRGEYHSPAPLPLFGLMAAFSTIKKLKRKYKKQYNF